MNVTNRSKQRRVAVLTLCDLTRAGLAALLNALGAEVIAMANADRLRSALRMRAGADLLVSDADLVEDAMRLAREQNLPLLVIAPTLGKAVGIAGHEEVTGVLAFPVAQSALIDALETIALGERYLPFELAPDLSGVQLSDRERELITLDLQRVSSDEIAQWMGIEVTTVYTYRSRLRRRLLGLELSERPEWVETWLGLFSS